MRSFPPAVTLPASSLLSPDSHWTQLEQTQSSGELLRQAVHLVEGRWGCGLHTVTQVQAESPLTVLTGKVDNVIVELIGEQRLGEFPQECFQDDSSQVHIFHLSEVHCRTCKHTSSMRTEENPREETSVPTLL